MESSEHTDVLIIGAGQSGLALGYHLQRRGLQVLLVDRNPRVGDSWRARWDSLKLYSPASRDGLPGMPFPASRTSYPSKDEMADYLEAYAEHFELPVRLGTSVEALTQELVDKARALIELAEQRGVITCPVHQFLFQAGVRRINEWLPTLGRIHHVEFSTCSAGAGGTDPASLDHLVAEILPHPLSLAATLLAAPLGASSWQIAHPLAGELRAITSVTDCIVSITISAHSRPTENVLRVLGSTGSATADLFHGFAVRREGVVSRRTKLTQPFVVAGRTFGSASVNLARRALRRELAYPGLGGGVQPGDYAPRRARPAACTSLGGEHCRRRARPGSNPLIIPPALGGVNCLIAYSDAFIEPPPSGCTYAKGWHQNKNGAATLLSEPPQTNLRRRIRAMRNQEAATDNANSSTTVSQRRFSMN